MTITQAQYIAMLSRTSPRDTKPALGPGPDRESDLHDQIADYCRGKGWIVHHSRMDKRSTCEKGWADFGIVTPKNVYFIEAKVMGRKLRPEQAAFRAQVLKLNNPNVVHAVVHSMSEFLESVKNG